ncbi:MAG: hypothetical protein ACR2L9_12625 [Solirubrobacteraceae bacterium]
MVGWLATVLFVGAALVAGCGGSPASAPRTLPASAVPYLPSSLKSLSAGSLAREMQAPVLTSELGAWGFEAGSDRYFQGESRRLQVVDSRTLRFGRVGGAVAYVGFVRAHVSSIVGSFPVLKPLVSGGRSGFLAVAQECQCHLANPAFLAVLARGGVVTWLEINGPGADTRRLLSLLAAAP